MIEIMSPADHKGSAGECTFALLDQNQIKDCR